MELLSHHFVEKLADEVWDGPDRVERQLLWFSTSWLALQKANNPLTENFDPFEGKIKLYKAIPSENKISNFGFKAW